MIEINLLPGKKKRAVAGRKFALPDFKTILAQVKDPWLIAAVVAWVLALGLAGGFFVWDGARLGRLNSRLDGVKAEKRRFDVVIAQKRNSEKIRDSLVSQINVIRGIDADRYIWPHVLDQITKALPPFTWLTSVQSLAAVAQQPGAPAGQTVAVTEDSMGAPLLRVSIRGRTVDFQAYTNFLRQLAASPWFTEVTPNQSNTVIESDRPVTEFNVTLRFRVADSVYIRTVPLVQSAR
ncbi:MAG: PilN domain-containing protein [Gemmatimonadetes bacterium]|nr:PilN domain-containing protein [Gemmatimonadota bacterium]